MHKLARQVRFSINPFLPEDSRGFNPFACEPTGEGLAIFLELSVELTGKVEPATGFVVNVTDIDSNVRKYVVPSLAERIREDYGRGKHIRLAEMTGLLKSAWCQLTDKFGSAKLSCLSLKLNPFRKICIDCEDCKVIYFSEKFEFAAMHKLWNNDFSPERNFEVFGKCANPTGHGHNYIVEVTVKMPTGGGLHIGSFERIVDNELIKLLDHKNLNADVEYFAGEIASVENIAVFAWDKLAGRFGEAELYRIAVWETDKTCCSYYGPQETTKNRR